MCRNVRQSSKQYSPMDYDEIVSGSRREKLTEIAKAFNVRLYSTVSQTIGWLNNLMSTDDKVVGKLNLLSQYLTLIITVVATRINCLFRCMGCRTC